MSAAPSAHPKGRYHLSPRASLRLHRYTTLPLLSSLTKSIPCNGIDLLTLDAILVGENKIDQIFFEQRGNPAGSEGNVVGITVEGKDEANGDLHVMPGVLKRLEDTYRDSECSRASTGSKSGNMAGEDPKNMIDGNYGNGVAYRNGHSAMNGNHGNGLPASAAGPQVGVAPEIEERLGLPPEIEHITFGYLPLSTVIVRLVQETFNGLTEVINEMSDLQVSQSSHHTPANNLDPHINGNGIVHNSQANVQKKLRILNFAQDRRAQFIKILVLSQWSRQADAISKVIDLKVWLDGQKRIYDDASVWMGELKRILAPLKMPNPDLKNALEALSLGKASWLPDVRIVKEYLLNFPSADGKNSLATYHRNLCLRKKYSKLFETLIRYSQSG